MKNKIYILGIVSTILIIAGGVFKVMHWPAAGILLTLGILNLCFCFFPIAFISCYKHSDRKKVWLFIAAFMTIIFNFVGALFKIMHWPGAGWFLVIGILSPVVLFIPVYIYYHLKEKDESLKNFMYIMFFLVFLSGLSAILAINTSKNVLYDAIRVAKISDLSSYYNYKRVIYDGFKTNRSNELQLFSVKIRLLKTNMLQ